jgi:conjugal transfer pilus assembly protein TraW
MLRLGLALLAVLVAVSAHAKNLGSVGTTYAIAEKDALTEIEERAKRVDWGKVLQRKPVEEYDGPQDRVRLPRAGRNRTFAVDMTYTLPMDIPDGKGGILYPQGYSFNPLDYVAFTKTLVVINGSDPEQVKWFAASEYRSRIDVMLLLTEGNYGRLGKRLDVPLFYADSRIVERLQLAAVPSVVKQEGKEMVVREMAVPRGAPGNYKAGALPTGGRNWE